ncbi:hypothetical protein ACIPW5_04660 [Streptomyces sp. NPDC090077]|uniref:hypothetical protein n=1 Tax=Streptomyces sp. NPDC090077 TaxID=3365938 RepID=UPI0037FEB330
MAEMPERRLLDLHAVRGLFPRGTSRDALEKALRPHRVTGKGGFQGTEDVDKYPADVVHELAAQVRAGTAVIPPLTRAERRELRVREGLTLLRLLLMCAVLLALVLLLAVVVPD